MLYSFEMDDALQELQVIPKNKMSAPKPPGNYAKQMSAKRKKFLEAFEFSFGNISASCEYADISRTTLYRWLNSKTRINVRFQNKLKDIKPIERQLDYVEGKLMERVKDGDTAAIIYTLKTRGKKRGYSEREALGLEPATQLLTEVAELLKQFLKDKPEFNKDEAVAVFARRAGVDVQNLSEIIQ